jgi:predicted MFS family arabinose efflux permease
MGIGVGIAASGTLVPLMLHRGLTRIWIGLGALALTLTLVAWTGWPRQDAVDACARHQVTLHWHRTWHLRALYAEYPLYAFGLVPHMIFLVDFVAAWSRTRIADRGAIRGWVLFGLGAVVGPVLSGRLADLAGFDPALRLAYLIQAAAVALPLFGSGSAWLIVSSVCVGALTPGIVPLVLGRVHELVTHHPAAQKRAWSKASISFAILQAVSAYGMSLVLVRSGGDYLLLFALGAGALVVMGVTAPRAQEIS